MKVDAAGRAFLTKEEGERLTSYQDSGGKWTIGVGHLMLNNAGPGVHITHEQSQLLLTADLARFEQAVSQRVTRPISQNAFNALVSFAFNLGEGNLAKSSLLRLVNAGETNPDKIKAAFALFCNVNGKPNAAIKARRLREATLFLTV